MLLKHHLAIARLSSDTILKYLIRDYFDLSRTTNLLPALIRKRLGQADLVICLLKLRDAHKHVRPAAEAHIASLMGHAIYLCPSCLLLYNPKPQPPAERTKDDLKIVYVTQTNPRQPGTEAHDRWSEYRIGRTVTQLLSRGVTKRDMRKAVRNGWIKMEDA